ncbi:MAG TPA: DMT family transporter [Candidatus Copromorpha excrementigallinarum]|uniref:DMT family transporter n=1 Tax=Candidatus Allocopromorpha excrementigallinarum TaxID=2840742 RepID=A0A9D1I1Z2_9FIRM|nr:DMT family transporter [Candidatus Copromorpha excrementigallinarum]
MKKAYFFVVLTAFLFGTMEVACKVAGNDLDPFQLTFIRFAIGGLMLLPFAVAELKKNHIRLSIRDIMVLAGVGTLGIPLSMVFFQVGVINSNASTASVLISINPMFTMVFAHMFTEEKLKKHSVAVLAVALLGLVFMIRPWSLQEGNTVLGIVSMLLASLFFGMYTVAGKVSVQKMGIMAQTSISFILGSLILLIMILIMGRPVTAGVADNLPLVLYVGIFVTGLGYFSYFMAIKLSDAATGSFAFFLKPAIAPLMAVIFLRETILWNTYVGIGLILAASYMNIRYQRKENEIKEKLENT